MDKDRNRGRGTSFIIKKVCFYILVPKLREAE